MPYGTILIKDYSSDYYVFNYTQYVPYVSTFI